MNIDFRQSLLSQRQAQSLLTELPRQVWKIFLDFWLGLSLRFQGYPFISIFLTFLLMDLQAIFLTWLATGSFVMVMSLEAGESDEAPLDHDMLLDQLLDSYVYNKAIRPGYRTGSPTIVHAQIHVNSISSISGISMDYHMDFYFRQRWLDKRLAFNSTFEPLIPGHDQAEKIWRPDTYFGNAKSGARHDITVPNVMFHLFRDGHVLISQRLTLVLSCNMDLRYFPMDTQTCHIILGSFGYMDRDIAYRFVREWPTSFEADMMLPEFIIDKEHVEEVEASAVYATGNFSTLKFIFHLERDIGYYLIQTYVPTTLVVVLSWVNFWLDVHATPARISLGLLTVLTMTTQTTGMNTQLPRVSYIRAIDVWMSVCLLFVFGALVEFAVANIIARERELRRDHKKMGKINLGLQINEKDDMANGLSSTEEKESKSYSMEQHVQPVEHHRRTPADKLERAAKFLFPISFGLFNLFYWLHYWCRWFQTERCSW